jgi:hypothetical protein
MVCTTAESTTAGAVVAKPPGASDCAKARTGKPAATEDVAVKALYARKRRRLIDWSVECTL